MSEGRKKTIGAGESGEGHAGGWKVQQDDWLAALGSPSQQTGLEAGPGLCLALAFSFVGHTNASTWKPADHIS